MKFAHQSISKLLLAISCASAMVFALSACSKAENEDVKAMRAIMEKQEREKEALRASSAALKARMDKAQAESRDRLLARSNQAPASGAQGK